MDHDLTRKPDDIVRMNYVEPTPRSPPREPNAAMIDAGDHAWNTGPNLDRDMLKFIWRAMYDAAPAPRAEVGVTDLEEWAWTILANAGGGNWKLETQDWQDAVVRWRDAYHAKLNDAPAKWPGATMNALAPPAPAEAGPDQCTDADAPTRKDGDNDGVARTSASGAPAETGALVAPKVDVATLRKLNANPDWHLGPNSLNIVLDAIESLRWGQSTLREACKNYERLIVKLQAQLAAREREIAEWREQSQQWESRAGTYMDERDRAEARAEAARKCIEAADAMLKYTTVATGDPQARAAVNAYDNARAALREPERKP